jgi:hypothetical protein
MTIALDESPAFLDELSIGTLDWTNSVLSAIALKF